MLIKVCDRCRRRDGIDVDVSWILLVSDSRTDESHTVDLCDGCYNLFRNWLTGHMIIAGEVEDDDSCD